jgi:hypothetical protein
MDIGVKVAGVGACWRMLGGGMNEEKQDEFLKAARRGIRLPVLKIN